MATVLALVLASVAVLAVTGTLNSCGEQGTVGRPSQAVSASRPGDFAWVMAKTISQTLKARPANTWGEIKARAFIFDAFQQYSYFPRTQEFIAKSGGRTVHSANIIAVKQGTSAQQLIIGAHYDSAAAGAGYADNASGVGLLLELAARLRRTATPYTLVFVAFGAEEDGLLGSSYYVRTMRPREKAATLGMIDLDSVAGGAHLSVASQLDAPGWLRDDVLTAAKELGIALQTSPALSSLAAGESDVPSDSRPFGLAGMPTATLTAASEGAVRSRGRDPLWHSRRDTVPYLEKTYPGRMRAQLHDAARVLDILLTSKLEKTP